MAGEMDVEKIKRESRHLRGSLTVSLDDATTGAVAPEDTAITKFHGIYQQDDRDIRRQRRDARLEPDYTFMIRVRVPGGVATPEQWLALDRIAERLSIGSLRLTTRQAVQFHGVAKENLSSLMQGLDEVLMDSISACGDVNRNVMCHVQPDTGLLNAETVAYAQAISKQLTPRSNAWREIWINGEKVDEASEEEPLYGETYLPRKFKIGIAVPPVNDIDVYSQDIGLIAIADGDHLQGFNVLLGGGLGCSQGDLATFPRLGDVAGYVPADQVITIAETIVGIQRDYGDRENRRHARFKYTVDDRGVDWMRDEIERRSGIRLDAPRPFTFEGNGDQFGWRQQTDGRYQRVVFIENGRLWKPAREVMATIVAHHADSIRITPNHNLVIAGIDPSECSRIDSVLREAGLDEANRSALRVHAMACVAFPTCSLAMAESERYMPTLMNSIEDLASRHGLDGEPITIRMSGCPNGCSRPYLSEIAFVGRAPGRYNMYLGAAFDGSRLNRLYLDNVAEPRILAVIDELFGRYAGNRHDDEHFGDYLVRSGVIAPTTHGSETNVEGAL